MSRTLERALQDAHDTLMELFECELRGMLGGSVADAQRLYPRELTPELWRLLGTMQSRYNEYARRYLERVHEHYDTAMRQYRAEILTANNKVPSLPRKEG